jgi:hypothetical protein
MPVYIANDVEAAGSRLGIHSTLSFGAAVITREELSFKDYWSRDLVFYAELQPTSSLFEVEAMRVGCSQLICLEKIKKEKPQYNTSSKDFDSRSVLAYMAYNCEYSVKAMKRFHEWIEKVSVGQRVVGVTDTVFFDGGRVDLLLSHFADKPSPYGHTGINLKQILQGHTRNQKASLSSLRVPDMRTKPHRADHDAVDLALRGRELLFNQLKW